MTIENDLRREFLRRMMATSAMASLASVNAMAPIVHAFGALPSALPTGKSIYKLKGEVAVNGKDASADTFIDASSTVETGSNSLAIFVVGKDAHILRENSRIELGGQGVVEEYLNLVSGKLLSVFGKRPQGKSTAINTTTATIGIRGTGVYAESDPDVSYVCTCYGTVDIASKKNPSESERITAVHHDSPRYIMADGKKGSLIEPAPVKNHTDEELLLIEALVGRESPISTLKSYSAPKRDY